MSTSNTRLPALARKADRLIEVMVFPHPPFWLTTAMLRMAPPLRSAPHGVVRSRSARVGGIAKLFGVCNSKATCTWSVKVVVLGRFAAQGRGANGCSALREFAIGGPGG